MFRQVWHHRPTQSVWSTWSNRRARRCTSVARPAAGPQNTRPRGLGGVGWRWRKVQADSTETKTDWGFKTEIDGVRFNFLSIAITFCWMK